MSPSVELERHLAPLSQRCAGPAPCARAARGHFDQAGRPRDRKRMCTASPGLRLTDRRVAEVKAAYITQEVGASASSRRGSSGDCASRRQGCGIAVAVLHSPSFGAGGKDVREIRLREAIESARGSARMRSSRQIALKVRVIDLEEICAR